MNRPTSLCIDSPRGNVAAFITANGNDWHIEIQLPGQADIEHRFRSVLHTRPDNGALEVTRLLRRDYGITGTFKTE